MASEYYLGLMAGTSLDAIDCSLVSFEHNQHFKLIHSYSENLSSQDKTKLLSLTKPQDNELELLIEMDVRLGKLFSQACLNTLKEAKFSSHEIMAIGSHGQTIRHFPDGQFKSTLQIGDANIIAETTGITTINDFRRRDMAAGGQGAPLVPPFHAALFQDSNQDRCVVNIGGIANITCLPADSHQSVIGFDTGPGNTLMDLFCQQTLNKPFDKNGDLARTAEVIPDLLSGFLEDKYFSQPYPKSTGREYFGEAWLTNKKRTFPSLFKHENLGILTTLTELTAISISEQINSAIPNAKEVLICGGGAKNNYLLERLSHYLPNKEVLKTDNFGLSAEWVESSAFAWLAMKTVHNQAGNLPTVTGAKHPVILGAIHPGRTKKS